jgi:hypothetical protein
MIVSDLLNRFLIMSILSINPEHRVYRVNKNPRG